MNTQYHAVDVYDTECEYLMHGVVWYHTSFHTLTPEVPSIHFLTPDHAVHPPHGTDFSHSHTRGMECLQETLHSHTRGIEYENSVPRGECEDFTLHIPHSHTRGIECLQASHSPKLQCVAVRCIVCCSVLQCVAVCCSVCCSMLSPETSHSPHGTEYSYSVPCIARLYIYIYIFFNTAPPSRYTLEAP